MMVSCSYCGGVHTRGFQCGKRPKDKRKKEETYITRFRSTNVWKRKREEIKARDKFLCQWCKQKGTYVFTKLEVHHIWPISKAWNKRLDNSNLITLCTYCHKMADNEEISRKELLEIVQNSAILSDAF